MFSELTLYRCLLLLTLTISAADSDHSMQMRGAYWELMNWLTDFLTEKWGEGGRTKQRWKMEKTEDTAKE